MSDFNWNDHPIVNSAPKNGGGFNWDDHPIVQQPSLIDSALGGLSSAINTVNSYTTAPTRAAISAAQNGNNPLPAFANQFGADPSTAPTGEQIALKAGASPVQRMIMTADQQQAFDQNHNPALAQMMQMSGQKYQNQIGASPAQVIGKGIDVAADPTLALPMLDAAKLSTGAAEVGGRALRAAEAIAPAKVAAPLVENADAIKSAAKGLGISDVPKALLTDNPTYQKLESGLAQSGSLPAKGIRDQYANFFKSVDAASDKIASLKSGDSDFAAGKDLLSDLSSQVSGKQAPVSEMYKALQPVMKKVEVNEPVVNRAFGVLRRNPLFQTADGKAMLDEYQATAKAQPDLNSLKEWRSTLSDSLGNNSTPLEIKRISALNEAVTSIRDNSINSLKESLPANYTNKKAALDDLIDHIQVADSAHASNIDDINSIKSLVGNKDFKSPSTFLSKLGDMKETDLTQRAANLDVGSMQNLQSKFPSIFEKAKAAKINDLIQSSTNPVSGFNDSSFLKKYQNLDPEMKSLLFQPEMQKHIENLQTIKSSIPEKLGPSGTPGGQMMMDMMNPKRNILDLGVRAALSKGPQAAGKVSSAAASQGQGGELLGKLLKLVPATASGSAGAGSALKAADNQPTKGPAKWANDGANKLIDHAPDDKATIEKGAASADPKVKQLLIQASDLKPGSRAMDAVMAKLKNKLAEGDE